MDGFKEFQGKDLDAAIQDACSYYNARREKLEIEILQDAKSGIFGIVGARKAKIRARRAQLRDTVQSVLGELNSHPRGERCVEAEEADGASQGGGQRRRSVEADEADDAPQGRGQRGRSAGRRPQPQARTQRPAEAADVSESMREDQPRRRQPRPERDEEQSRERRRQPRPEKADRDDDGERLQTRGRRPGPRAERGEEADNRPQIRGERRPQAPVEGMREEQPRRRQPRPERDEEADKTQTRARRQGVQASPMQDGEEGPSYRPLEEADAPRAMEAALEAVSLLLRPLVDQEPEISASVQDGAVSITIQNLGDAAPALIGRDGSTLAAVQYLAGRLVGRGLERSVRVSLDAGSYRQRQEEELRDMTLALAEKVVKSGRSLSTRPLSSFQRRIVHVYLKEVEGIQTRSTGEGALKRVIIMRRRPKGRPQAEAAVAAGTAPDALSETVPAAGVAHEAAPAASEDRAGMDAGQRPDAEQQ